MEFLKILAIKERADCCITAWSAKIEDSHWLQSFRVKEFCHTISRAGYQHGMIIGDSEGKDLALVYVCLHQYFLIFNVMNEETTLIS